MSPKAMTSAPEDNQAATSLQNGKDEVRSLHLIERTFTRIEHAELKCESQPYNPAAVTAIIERLDEEIHHGKITRIAEAQEELTTEFQSWRLSISRRDAQITAHTLRRFCRRGTSSLDTQALSALLRFYRNLGHLSQSQSKYDFVATRLFTLGIEEHRRKLRFGRDQIAERLQQMAATWHELNEAPLSATTEISDAVRQFTDFTSQVNALHQLAELVSSRLFEAIRTFKAGLGELFYVPEITAAAIACNVACADQFVALLEQEGEQLNGAAENYGELAALFSDTSARSADQSAHLLSKTRLADQQSAAPEREKFARLSRLLNLAPAPPVEEPETAEPAADHQTSPAVAAIVLDETLEDLAVKPENRVILAMFHKSSPRTRKLELRMFLSPLARTDAGTVAPEFAEIAAARRHALTLIISADHLQHLKAEPADQAAQSQEQKITSLLEEMQAVGSRLQELIEWAAQNADPNTVETLGHVAARLFDAQQTLQAAIFDQSAVRFARHQSAQNRADNQAGVSFTQSLKSGQPGLSKSATIQQINKYKWLIMVTILIAVASVVLLFTTTDSASAVALDPDVQILDLSQVPNGDLLKSARTRRTLMICLVSEKWKQMSDDQRREKLQAWLEFGKNKKVEIITVLNEQGQPVGSASAEAISLDHT